MPNQTRNTFAYAAILVALTLTHTDTVEAGIYNRMQSSASSTFNPLARMILRGGETKAALAPGSLKPLTSITTASTSSSPRIPKVRTSIASTSTSIPKTVKHKKRRKKKTSATSSETTRAPISSPPVPLSATKKDSLDPVPPKVMAPAPVLPPAPTEDEAPATTTAQEIKSNESKHDKMPSIFYKDEEKQYDTYAACLAATESLRRIRDSKIKNKTGSAVASDDKSWKSMLKTSVGGDGSASSGSGIDNKPTGKEELKRACAEYVLNSSKAINVLGLSVTQFNQLGREVYKNKELKEKVRNWKEPYCEANNTNYAVLHYGISVLNFKSNSINDR